MRNPLSFGLSCFLAATLVAQPAELTRAGAMLLVDCDGPALLRRKFSQTKLGAMLNSARLEAMIAPLRAEIGTALDERASVEQRRAKAALGAFAGQITLALWCAPAADTKEPQVWAYVALSPDGATDLAAVCTDTTSLMRDAQRPAELRQVSIGDRTWHMLDITEPNATALEFGAPQMVGEHAVWLFCSGGARARLGELFVPATAGGRPAAKPDAAPVRMQFEAATLVQAMLAGAGDDRERATQILALLGLDQLGAVSARLDTAETSIALAIDMAVGRGNGLWAVFMPEKPPAGRALGLVPRSASVFSAGPFIWPELLALAQRASSTIAEFKWDDVEAQTETALGVRLGADLLAHLGDEMFTAYNPQPIGLDTNDTRASLTSLAFSSTFAGMTVGITLRDGRALERSIDKLLEHTGMARMRKTETVHAHAVHRVSVPVLTEKLHWVITDDLLVAGLGDAGRAHLHSVLEARSARARGEPAAEFPANLGKRLNRLPAGYRSLSVASATSGFDQMIGLIGIVLTADRSQQVTETWAELKDLLRVHDLQYTVSASYAEPGWRRIRTLW